MLIAAILHADGDQPADLEPHHDASNYIFNIVGRTAEVDHHRRIFQEIGRIGGLLFEPGNKVRIVDILKRHHQDRERACLEPERLDELLLYCGIHAHPSAPRQSTGCQ